MTDHNSTVADDAANSPSPRKSIWPAAILLIVVVAIWALVEFRPQSRRADEAGPVIGRRLPRLELQPLTGKAQAVSLSDLEGKVVLLDFWGTWCPPCIDELPHLAALAKKYEGNEDLLVLPVSCPPPGQDDTDLASDTQQFLRDYHLDLPTYRDADSYTRHAVAQVASFNGYPTTLILDRRGAIRGFWQGYLRGDEREIEKKLKEVLEETQK